MHPRRLAQPNSDRTVKPPPLPSHGSANFRVNSTTRKRLAALALASALVMLGPRIALAEVSAQDGYGPNGTYRVHVDLVPYVWLPAVSGEVKLGNGASANINQGVPSVSDITSKLKGAFIGAGLVRYGPWSAEIDIQYIAADENKNLPTGFLGISRSLQVSELLVRVAPGFGYQVYNGALGQIPTTVDVRAGFSYFASNAELELNANGPLGRQRISTVSANGSFVQPWLGFRADIYPWPRWRFELGALVQGFGVDGGVWGWGTSLTASWAATHWLNLIGGFRALNTGRNLDSSAVVHSLSLTGYGPVLGMEFTF